MSSKEKAIEPKIDGTLPLLPLRGMVVFPGSLIQVFVGRAPSIAAIKEAIDSDNLILLSTQLKAEVDNPSFSDLYEKGTLATIIRVHNLPDGTARVMLEGIDKFELLSLEKQQQGYTGQYRIIEPESSNQEKEPLLKLMLGRVREFLQYRQQPSDQAIKSLEEATDQPDKLIGLVIGLMPFTLDEKYSLLDTSNEISRLELLIALVESHIEMLRVDEKIHNRIRKQISKGQKEHYLNEQMKAIQKEITDLDETKEPLAALEKSIADAKMSKEANNKAQEELTRLRMMPAMSSEATVVRSFIDTLISLPWSKKSRTNKDISKAKKQLDGDHYALGDVKERILEYLAVSKRAKNLRAPVLCLVGPPGVGKTSLGKSIAKATGRDFIRLSLGGVRDESEIRGHRKTYIGSMPGRIIQKMSKSGTNNPLFLLDEIDKMGQDFRGDPASALLEVLDPEQNSTFNDHYLEVDYDLSDVLFICTSNSMNIPDALLDRLEVIRLAGYTEDEKLHIAREHLVSRQLQQHAITKELTIDDSAIKKVIRCYTREAGVRELERKLGKVVRRFVFRLESGEIKKKDLPATIKSEDLQDLLGPEKFNPTDMASSNEVGIVNGLAWTQFGGELLKIETLAVPGKGEFVMTGSLGDVMQESIRASMTIVRSKSHWLGLPEDFFKKHDIHIHMPEGATPKDGPSAGIAMCTALFSLLSGIAVRGDVAMTGEVTISGKVLPIGGLKEKVLAAQRSGVVKVLIPEKNVKDLVEIPEEVLKQVECVAVKTIDEVLKQALESFDDKWLPLANSSVTMGSEHRSTQTH